MNIYGQDVLFSALESEGFFIKLILNESAAHFFPASTEHRDATQPGLCYQDDSHGNALAATVKPGRMDIRLHAAFSENRVRLIVERLLTRLATPKLARFEICYGGKVLT